MLVQLENLTTAWIQEAKGDNQWWPSDISNLKPKAMECKLAGVVYSDDGNLTFL